MVQKKKKNNEKKIKAKKTVARRSGNRKKTAQKVAQTRLQTQKAKKVAAHGERGAVNTEEVAVLDLNGKKLDSVKLDALIREGEPHSGVIYQAVLMYRAGEREGTASTLDRGHVRGGGKKPWRQKGTGQARHGSRRSPIWRGGGTTFGPSPRNYAYSLPAQMKRRAVVEALKEKVKAGKLVITRKMEVESAKTQDMVDMLEALKVIKPLLLVEQKASNLLLATRNLPQVSVKTAQEVNAMDILTHQECVMTEGAYAGLMKRLKS